MCSRAMVGVRQLLMLPLLADHAAALQLRTCGMI